MKPMPFKVVTAEPNEDVIQVLREMSHDAYAGRIQVLACFYIDDTGEVMRAGAGECRADKLIQAADDWLMRMKFERLYPELIEGDE